MIRRAFVEKRNPDALRGLSGVEQKGREKAPGRLHQGEIARRVAGKKIKTVF